MLVPVPQGSVAAKETTQRSVARHRLWSWLSCLRRARRLLFACEKDRDRRSIEFPRHHLISALRSADARLIQALAKSMLTIAHFLYASDSRDCFARLPRNN